MKDIIQPFQGVIFNITYFKKIENELLNYQLNHKDECIPILPFFTKEHKRLLNNFYVSDIKTAKSYDNYMFDVTNKGFPKVVKEFIQKHQKWSKLIIKYDY